MSKKSLSIFIPVYNEEKIIDTIISAVATVAESISDNYEILIINDGSIDDSKERILKWTDRNNKIRLISHETNLGYGSALRTGFENATKDLIFYTDADMPADLNEIKTVLPLMERYDLVIGYRINRGDAAHRYLYSKIYNFLLRVLLEIKVRDANFAFKCIRKEAVKKCNLSAKSVFIDGELLAEAVRNDLTVKEVPLIYKPRQHGNSNFDSLRTAVFTAREILSYWILRYLFGKFKKALRKTGALVYE